MKKFLAIILSIVMTLGMLCVSAQAATPSLTLSSVADAEAGTDVTLELSISGNPGFATMTLTGTYASGLTLKSATCAEGLTLTKGKNIVINEESGENYTEDGVIATFVFTLDSEAASGDYLVSYKLQRCRNASMANVTFGSTTIAGTITIPCEEAAITAADVVVSDNLDLEVGIEVPKEVENPKVRFTLDGNETVTEAKSEDENNKFVLPNITAEKMSDTVKIEILDDSDEVLASKDYSIRDYCNGLYKEEAEPESQAEKLNTLLANMLEYGAMAQKYVEHNTDNLANNLSWVPTNKKSYEISESDYNVTKPCDSNDFKIKSAYLNLGDNIKICFKLTAPDYENAVFYLTVDDETTTYNLSDYKPGSDNTIIIITEGLAATAYDKIFTARLEYEDSVVHEITYSVNSYIAAKQNSTVANLANMVAAINNYGKAAKEYVSG